MIQPASTQLPIPPRAPQVAYLGLELPMELRDLVLRHHRNLSVLIASLNDVGIGPDAAQRHVDVLIDEYRSELSLAVTSFPQEETHV